MKLAKAIRVTEGAVVLLMNALNVRCWVESSACYFRNRL